MCAQNKTEKTDHASNVKLTCHSFQTWNTNWCHLFRSPQNENKSFNGIKNERFGKQEDDFQLSKRKIWGHQNTTGGHAKGKQCWQAYESWKMKYGN